MRFKYSVVAAGYFVYLVLAGLLQEPAFEVPPPGAIIVTGAASGIGRHTAEALARALPHHDVYGVVRREKDVANLHSSIRGIVCDLTDDTSIDLAMEKFVKSLGDKPLVGFFDSAGLVVPNVPVESIDLALLRRLYAVDVVGLVAILKHVIPLIRHSKGRLCFMGSVTGAATPSFFGMDTARPIEVIADAARRELRPLGVGVSVIQSGFVDSPIIDKTKEADAALHATKTRDGRLITDIYTKLLAKAFESQVARDAMAPMSVVSDAVKDALRSSRPQIRYVVGTVPTALPTRLLVALMNFLPSHILDLFD